MNFYEKSCSVCQLGFSIQLRKTTIYWHRWLRAFSLVRGVAYEYLSSVEFPAHSRVAKILGNDTPNKLAG